MPAPVQMLRLVAMVAIHLLGPMAPEPTMEPTQIPTQAPLPTPGPKIEPPAVNPVRADDDANRQDDVPEPGLDVGPIPD